MLFAIPLGVFGRWQAEHLHVGRARSVAGGFRHACMTQVCNFLRALLRHPARLGMSYLEGTLT